MGKAGDGDVVKPIATLGELEAAEQLLAEWRAGETEPGRDFLRDWAPGLLLALRGFLEAVAPGAEDSPVEALEAERADDAGQLMTRTEALVYVQHLMAEEYLDGHLAKEFEDRSHAPTAPKRDRADAKLALAVVRDLSKALRRANAVALMAAQKVHPAGAVIHVPGSKLPTGGLR